MSPTGFSWWLISPIGSMYGIFNNIHPKNHPNVGKYTIQLHGAYGSVLSCEFCRGPRKVPTSDASMHRDMTAKRLASRVVKSCYIQAYIQSSYIIW
jgi:hypothetical protein